MTETENTGRTLTEPAPPQTYGARRGERRRPPDRRTTAALVLSALALAIACVSLVLQLRPAPEPEPEPIAVEPEPEPETPTIQYRNHVIPILESVPVNGYDAGTFETDENGFVSYRDAPAGIDVSSYQGEIDWKKVAGSGVSFAMLRAGMRGYTKGGLMTDATFEKNYKGARAAGVDVGVYFFSQATSVEEAEEEADYLFALLDGRALTYPVVFDWESVNDAAARTNGVDAETVTRCARAFCDKVVAAGYTPMIYFNMDQGYLAYRLDELTDYAFWLAEYHDSPAFYYGFDLWQYTHRGSVPGIEGPVDLDLDLRGFAEKPSPEEG